MTSGLITTQFGEFERPADRRPDWFWDNVPESAELTVLRMTLDQSVVAGSLKDKRGRRGVGVWEVASGRFRWGRDWADAVRFAESSPMAVAFDDDRIGRYSWPEMTLVDEVGLVGYPPAETLALSPSERFAVVWQRHQGDAGCEVFALDGPIRRVAGGTSGDAWSMPAFSPSENLLACSTGSGDPWWTPDPEEWAEQWDEWLDVYYDECYIPSVGGRVRFGRLIIHDLQTGVGQQHTLEFDLPVGWRPELKNDRYDYWVYGASGIEFLTDDRIRLRLPDDSTADLQLPLPDVVLLPTPEAAEEREDEDE
ncbi:hypothetical protein [Streptomyces sp. NPDC001282]|uniref:hypothetical protein n=1 Tax=Streptomyces sp. NPDC001282 TaxID=3364557 RepID=UPI003685FF22